MREILRDDARRERLAALLAELARREPYLYPWENLEQDVGQGRLPVLGYGSLVNLESAARTLTEPTRATARPAIVFGGRRVFDYAMPENLPHYGPPGDPRARAALNVRPTGSVDDGFNGLLFELTAEDIEPMRRRERGYDLHPFACLPWDALDAEPTVAWALCAPEAERAGRVHVDRTLTPHEQYYRVCRHGAEAVDEDFLGLWLATTLLADGTTPVKDWEAPRKTD